MSAFRRTPPTRGGARLYYGCSWQRDSYSRVRDSYSHEWDSCSGGKVVRFLSKVVQLFGKWYGFSESGTTFSCISCSRQREQLSQRRDKLIQRWDKLIQRWDELSCAHARTPAPRAEVFKKNAFTFHNPYVERDCGNLTFHIAFTTPSHLYIGTSMAVPCSTTAVS